MQKKFEKFICFLQLLRIHQWIKNSFVLAGVIFGHNLTNIPLLKSALLAALGFCFISSSVYIYNDMIDISEDKLHPVKKNRPIAANKISIKTAKIIGIVLLILAFITGFLASQKMIFFLGGYFLLNIIYTRLLKKIIILDVLAISAGFMLRILAGTSGLNIPPSGWLLLCTLSLTLFLGFAKRRAELYKNRLSSREVLKKYSLNFLNTAINITAGFSIMSYALYTISPETIRVHHTHHLIYTVPLVISGIFRYLYLLKNLSKTTLSTNTGEDISKDLFNDKYLMLIIFIFITAIISITLFPESFF